MEVLGPELEQPASSAAPLVVGQTLKMFATLLKAYIHVYKKVKFKLHHINPTVHLFFAYIL